VCRLPQWRALAFALIAALSSASAQDILDPAFQKIPFDTWFTEKGQARFDWSARAIAGELGSLQRLRARIEVTVDGNELVKRRGHGDLLFFVQINDAHHRYQSHGSLGLRDVNESAGKSNFVFAQNALVTPGNYRVAIGIQDSQTGEHATVERSLHVSPFRNDPLPQSWEGLPAVEFTEGGDPPDVWFQPTLTGRLHLPLETRRGVRLHVLVNASPSALGPRYHIGQASNRSLAEALPGLKVISDMAPASGSLDVSMFDLTRRQVLFAQDHVDPRKQPLDWPRLRAALLEWNPNKIDVSELEDQEHNAQFFVEKVRERCAAGAPTAVIILSGPMDFSRGADLRPIALAHENTVKVFYLRYHPPPVRAPVVASSQAYHGRRRGIPSDPGFAPQEPVDALEPLLKPLQPRVFEVYDPGQFRKALAELMEEIGRM